MGVVPGAVQDMLNSVQRELQQYFVKRGLLAGMQRHEMLTVIAEADAQGRR